LTIEIKINKRKRAKKGVKKIVRMEEITEDEGRDLIDSESLKKHKDIGTQDEKDFILD
jgi:hypothetical protein